MTICFIWSLRDLKFNFGEYEFNGKIPMYQRLISKRLKYHNDLLLPAPPVGASQERAAATTTVSVNMSAFTLPKPHEIRKQRQAYPQQPMHHALVQSRKHHHQNKSPQCHRYDDRLLCPRQ